MPNELSRYQSQLGWIDQQHERMCALVSAWANINSGTHNLAGLNRLSAELRREFQVLGGAMSEIPLQPSSSIDERGNAVVTPHAPVISIRKRRDAATQVFLGIHMDTVYAPEHPFQSVEQID